MKTLAYKAKEFYCADGFPKEGDKCFIVIPSPYRD